MYSSPEQTRKNSKLDGRSGECTRRADSRPHSLLHTFSRALSHSLVCIVGCADIWSCGVILYQMLALLVDVPFDPVEIIINKSTVPPLSLYTVTPLSDHMHRIVMKALEVDPSKRFGSAEEMGDALHKEESRLLDGIKTPTTAFPANTDATAPAASKSSASSPPPAASPAPDTAAAAAPTSPSAPAPFAHARPNPPSAAATTLESALHPRYQRGRSKKPFASGETENLPSKL
jgi:serine/threonine protein kinase